LSSIDQYKHKLIGHITCPSTNSFVDGREETREIAIYELLENIRATEECFDGKAGDILVGGGRGEAPALRISNPFAFQFFTLDDECQDIEFNSYDEIFKCFWSPTKSYIFGEGFMKLGWTTDIQIELWLAENVCKLLISNVDKYSIYKKDRLDLKTNLTFSIDDYS